jgi:hypothetical protein
VNDAVADLELPVTAHDDGPARIIVMVDTEEEFDWTAPFDRSATGVDHMRRIAELQAVFDAHRVRPVYDIDYPIADQAVAVDALAPIVADGSAFIGAHLHPWVTPPFSEEVTRRNSFPGNLPPVLEREKLEMLTERITRSFGFRPTIYKAGRYGVGPNSFAILEELGYRVDVSPMPPFDYRREEGPDFSRRGCAPRWVGPNRRILSIPNTGAHVGWLPRLGLEDAAALSIEPPLKSLRAPAILSRLRLFERIALSPEGYTLGELVRLTVSLFRQGQRLFVLSMHSPSVAPGHTLYVRDESDRLTLLSRLDRYLDFFCRELGGAGTDPLAELQALLPDDAAIEPAPLAPAPPPKPKAAVVALTPIGDADLPEIVEYWHHNLNRAILPATWTAAFSHPWMPHKPNNGFMLRADGRLVGTLGAIYSEQVVGEERRNFLNLTSLVVDEKYRARSMDLLAACLRQKDLCFTNFTPTPAVARMLRLLRFQELPSDEFIIPHVPMPPAAMKLRALTRAADLDGRLTGNAARLWRDHRDIPWLNRFAIGQGAEWCLVFWKPGKVRALPGAHILGVSDPERFIAWNRAIGGHFALRHGIFASRIRAHQLPDAVPFAFRRPATMPHLVRGDIISGSQTTLLYSELVALPIGY